MNKMNLVAAAAGVALGIGAWATNADARVLMATYTGTIYSGYDGAGLFGSPGASLAGDAYIITYTIDTTKGDYGNYLPQRDLIIGGPGFGGSYGDSPVSATINVRNVTQSVPGSWESYAMAFPDPTILNKMGHEAADYFMVGQIQNNNYVNMGENDISPPRVLDTLPLTTIHVQGYFQF
jgi:hypothetical protein